MAFFLIIKSASEPAAPKIILDPSVAVAETTSPTADSSDKPQNLAVLMPVAVNKSLLMPNETLESVPQATTLTAAKTLATKEIVIQDKAPIDLLETELAKKKAKQKAKKKIEESATKQNASEAKPKQGATDNGSSVNKPSVQQPDVVAAKTEVKKTSVQEKSGQEKSGWNTFKDSVKQGGENKCSQAQIAMNQCN